MLTITRRLLLVAVIPLAVFVPATAGGDPPQQPVAAVTAPATNPQCSRGVHSVEEFKAYARKVYRRTTVSKEAQGRMAYMKRCQHSSWAKRVVKRYAARYKREREARQAAAKAAAAIAALTPYSCGFGNFAIPCYIVRCESTDGGWDTINSIGARGPYQFLGWPVPWPVVTEAHKLAHHRMAARLWAGGAGRSHWQECLS